jgi:hypothetical protein
MGEGGRGAAMPQGPPHGPQVEATGETGIVYRTKEGLYSRFWIQIMHSASWKQSYSRLWRANNKDASSYITLR